MSRAADKPTAGWTVKAEPRRFTAFLKPRRLVFVSAAYTHWRHFIANEAFLAGLVPVAVMLVDTAEQETRATSSAWSLAYHVGALGGAFWSCDDKPEENLDRAAFLAGFTTNRAHVPKTTGPWKLRDIREAPWFEWTQGTLNPKGATP